MKISIIFVLALLFIYTPSCYAGSSASPLAVVDKEKAQSSINKFDFMNDYIDSIYHLYMSTVRIEDSRSTSTDDSHLLRKLSETMKGLYRSNTELEMAKNVLTKYRNQNQEIVSQVVETNLKYYDMLVNMHLKFIDSIKKLYDAQVNAKSFDYAQWSNENARMNALNNDIMESFSYSSILATGLLVYPNPDKNGKMSIVDLTTQQRDQMIEKIDLLFGDEVKKEMYVGEDRIILSAAGIRRFLTTHMPKDLL